MSITFLGAIIVVLGGIIGAFGTYYHNKKSSEKSDRIDTNVKENIIIGISTKEEIQILKNQNKILQDQLDKQFKTIDELRVENTNLYQQLASISKDIFNNITGGDSFCEVILLKYDNGKSAIFALSNEGNYPLKDIKITMIDIQKFKNIKRLDNQAKTEDFLYRPTFEIDNLLPKRANGFANPIEINENQILEYNFNITTNSRQFSQRLKVLKTKNDFLIASQLKEVGNGNILMDKANKGFPNEKNGKIDW